MSERNAKREQFTTKPNPGKRLLVPAIIIVTAALAVGAWFLFGSQSVGGPQIVTAGQDGAVRLTVADYHDGQAHFYRFQGQNGPIDFFVVKSSDGVIRSAFDTCDVCYKERKGYRQEGHEMVCNNCDQRFPTDRINVIKGGCNPAPLKRELSGEVLVIAANDIEQGARYFKGAVN
jgi:uncharacterized membrane protein